MGMKSGELMLISLMEIGMVFTLFLINMYGIGVKDIIKDYPSKEIWNLKRFVRIKILWTL